MNQLSDIFSQINLFSKLTSLQVEECKDKFIDSLNKLDLDSINFHDRIKLLINILNECKKVNSSKSVTELVLYRWCHDDLDVDGVIGDLAATTLCKMDILKYLVSTFNDSTIVSILDLHIRTRYGSGMVFSLVCDRLLQAYDLENLDEYEWRALIEASVESNNSTKFDIKFLDRQSNYLTKDNKDVLDYIDSKIKDLNKNQYAPKPSYVNLLEGESEEIYLNYLKDVKLEDQNESQKEVNELKELLYTYTNKTKVIDSDLGETAPITTDEVIDVFVSLKDNMSNFVKKEVKNTNPEEVKNSFPIERYFGPSNSIIGTNCMTSITEIGPCRMFRCICREFDDNDDEISYDEDVKPEDVWFTGNCDICQKKISNYRHALRFPIDGGGWIGCYCSFECLENTEIRPIYKNDEFRINEIKNIINICGIADL
jgi:hypothetical protein